MGRLYYYLSACLLKWCNIMRMSVSQIRQKPYSGQLLIEGNWSHSPAPKFDRVITVVSRLPSRIADSQYVELI